MVIILLHVSDLMTKFSGTKGMNSHTVCFQNLYLAFVISVHCLAYKTSDLQLQSMIAKEE